METLLLLVSLAVLSPGEEGAPAGGANVANAPDSGVAPLVPADPVSPRADPVSPRADPVSPRVATNGLGHILTGDDLLARAPKAPRAWLGVQVGPVPPSLAAHLALAEGAGVLVLDVVEGSPADKAGIGQYDVIRSLDGKEIDGGPDDLISRLGKEKPGAKVKLATVRRGKEREVEVELGRQEGAKAPFNYRFRYEPPEIDRDALNVRRFSLRKSPDGVFRLQPGGGAAGGASAPKGSTRSSRTEVEVRTEDGHFQARVLRERDGEKLEVRRDKKERDGAEKIVVTRTRKDDKGVEHVDRKEYSDVEAVKKADPEAHELLGQVEKKGGVHAFATVRGSGGPGAGSFRIEIPEIGIGIGDDIGEVLRKHGLHLDAFGGGRDLDEQVKRSFELARRQIEEAWGPRGKGGKDAGQRVDRKFVVEEDGRIRVTVTRGGSSVETSYKSEEDLEKRAPKLYAAYKKLLEGE